MATASKGALRTAVFALMALVPCAARSQDAPAPELAFSVPLVDETHCKAWQEFRRLLAERQWSKAFRAVSDDLEQPPQGLLPPQDGFSFDWRTQVRRDLGALDAEGRRAFDLFFGSRARKLLEDALAKPPDDPAREAALATAFHAYGPTTGGTRAGDQLAAAALGSGRCAEAVEIWEWILKSGATDGYDPRDVRLGLSRAFARQGRRADFEHVAVSLEERWGSDVVAPEGSVRELVARLRAGLPAEAETRPAERLALPDAVAIGWETQAPPPKKEDRGRNRVFFVGGRVRAVVGDGNGEEPVGLWGAVDGTTVYASDGARIRALDLETGKVRWNRAHYWQPGLLREPWILPAGDRVYVSEARREPFCRISCRDVSDGAPRWSADLESNEDCISPPLVDGNELYAVIREGGAQHITLCSFNPANGKKRWSLDLGTAAAGGNEEVIGFGRHGYAIAPDARVLKCGSRIVVFTDGGAAIAVDPHARRLCWAALLDSRAGSRFEPGSQLAVLREGSIAYATLGGNELVALDMDRAKLCWRRGIDASAGLVAMDRERFYVAGDEICAYSRKDRTLLWARPAKGASERIVETRDHLYAIFAQGLREISKADGDDVRVLRGDQDFFQGGQLWSTPAGLVCVGGSKVSLLRMGGSGGGNPATKPKSKEEKSKEDS